MILSDRDIRRFWSKVTMPDTEGHMLWTGKPDSDGYGKFGYMVATGRQRASLASRVSCWLAHGAPPEPRFEAAHECTIRLCVAPEHLNWKTPAGNAGDRRRDGTQSQGERHPFARLTEEQVREIRAHPEISHAEFGRRFGVTYNAVSAVRRGRTWKEMP